MEVALRIHEPDADERQPEVAGFLAMIAGQHAEAAGIDRQRLVQRELRREIRDDPAAEHRACCRSTTGARLPRVVETGDRLVVEPAENGIVRRALERSAPRLLQHLHRVVRGGAPQRVIKPAEYLACTGCPSSTTSRGEFAETMDARRKRSGKAFHGCLVWKGRRGRGAALVDVSVETGAGVTRARSEMTAGDVDRCRHAFAPTSPANRERSMLPPETTATIFPVPALPLSAAAIGAGRRRLRRRRGRARPACCIAAATSSSDTTIEPSTSGLQQRPHGRQHGLAARAVDERRPATRRSSCGCAALASDGRERRRGLGFGRDRCARFGLARAHHRRRCRPAVRRRRVAATTASTSGRSSRISRPAVALPAMKSSSSNGWTKWPRMRSERVRFDRAPALVVGGA